jgi:hypothetical protein
MAIREGKWKCAYCGAVNLGREMKCAQCGQPRGKDVRFFLDDDAAEVTDQGLLSQASAGADWTCSFCGTNNQGGATSCKQCGAERGSSASLKEKVVPAPGQSGPSAPSDGSAVPAAARRLSPLAIAGIAVGAVAVMALLYFLFFTAREATAVLDRGEWQRSIAVEELRLVTRQAWEGSVPAGATVLRTWDEKYGTEKIQTGTERRKTGTRDKGNGFFEDVYEDVPVYTERDVYKKKVEFKIQEWVETRTVKAQGDMASPPAWPALTLAAAEREKGRQESAAVYFTLDGKSHKYAVPVEKLGAFTVGARYKIWLTPLGAVKDAQKP